MLQFFINGGFPMWFVLLFGLASLVGATVFAVRPGEHGLGSVRAIAWATAFASVAGFIAGVAVTFSACAQLPDAEQAQWYRYALQGLSESSSNLILGASLLALTWLVIAIGLRRLAAREA